ncbi:MAG: hypothetical protein FJZ75_10585 [Bacteroidetes bacterium]|nr:hypothetical protein [Bacteroidota bacterium]
MDRGVHECRDSGVPGFAGARIHGCVDLWLQGWTDIRIRGFTDARTNAQGCTLC